MIIKFMLNDKKNNTNKINLILLKKIGKPLLIRRYDKKIIKSFLREELVN